MIKKTDDIHYKAIANAIRDKNGETTKYKPAQMAAAIGRLSPIQVINHHVKVECEMGTGYSVELPITISIKNIE